MDKNIKQRWINALRSGKYRRGKSCLCIYSQNRKKFCCLGVLTDLYLHDNNGRWVKKGTCYMPEIDGRELGRTDLLPKEVKEWAKLSLPDPVVKYSEYKAQKLGMEKTTLSDMNDETARGFDEIARAIERTF